MKPLIAFSPPLHNFGDPLPEILASIYDEFQRWRELLKPDLQASLLTDTNLPRVANKL